jgi:SPP1 family predicted phage head-tail adaptor
MRSRSDFGGIGAGELRHKLTLQRCATTQGPAGKPIYTYTTVGAYRANVEPLTGLELFNARQLKATITHKITMRVIGEVLPSDRFLFESTGRVFNVNFVFRESEVQRLYKIMATELKAPQ